jgi:hypothetical protein
MAEECRIKCKVRKGAFEDEMIARISVVDSAGLDMEAECWAYGNSVIPQSQPVQGHEVDGVLKAFLLQRRGELASVVLPQSTFQNGPSVIVRTRNLL